MTDYFLFLDLETTGLDPRDTTVLECGWTVTDDKLVQRSPLRSRFVALSTSGRLIVPDGSSYWASNVETVVRDMHRDSGLVGQWRAAPELSIIRRPADLERLLVDDLLAAGWTGGKGDTVHLAGAGVSHYDRSVLDELPVLQLSGGKGSLLHYRAADSSVAATLLGVSAPKKPADLAEMVSPLGTELTLVTDVTTAHLSREGGVAPGETLLDVHQVRNHRAADDVAFSLVFARCLRRLVTT